MLTEIFVNKFMITKLIHYVFVMWWILLNRCGLWTFSLSRGLFWTSIAEIRKVSFHIVLICWLCWQYHNKRTNTVVTLGRVYNGYITTCTNCTRYIFRNELRRKSGRKRYCRGWLIPIYMYMLIVSSIYYYLILDISVIQKIMLSRYSRFCVLTVY